MKATSKLCSRQLCTLDCTKLLFLFVLLYYLFLFRTAQLVRNENAFINEVITLLFSITLFNYLCILLILYY